MFSTFVYSSNSIYLNWLVIFQVFIYYIITTQDGTSNSFTVSTLWVNCITQSMAITNKWDDITHPCLTPDFRK